MSIINLVYGHTKIPGYVVHRGDISVVWSQKPLRGCDIYAYQDAFSYCGPQPGLNVLLLLEPVVVLPGQYNEEVWDRFDHILTWSTALVETGGNFIKIPHPNYDVPYDSGYLRVADCSHRVPQTEKKTAVCVIAGNKVSRVSGELYSQRRQIARWFYDHSDMPFDVYGMPAFQLPNYRGALTPYTQKFATLARYRFCLAFENMYHPVWSRGYVTEKLLDCFMCATVPIYLGCADIEQYVPPTCFIDFRNFKNYRELEHYLQSMPAEQYRHFLDNMTAWVDQGHLDDFSYFRVYDALAHLILSPDIKTVASPAQWQPGPAPVHKTHGWQSVAASPVWTWTELAGAAAPDKLPGEISAGRQQARGRSFFKEEPPTTIPAGFRNLEKHSGSDCAVGIVFSKDRALQLDGMLRSLQLHCLDIEDLDLKVLYATSQRIHERQYEALKTQHRKVGFVKEKRFKQDLLAMLTPYRYVFFMVDDNIFIRDFTLAECLDKMAQQRDTLGFSLRLGKNTTYQYMTGKPQSLPNFKGCGDGCLKWDWTRGDGDFGYPLEVSSSVYRVYDILLLLHLLDFNNPNTLEAGMDGNKKFYKIEKPCLCCFEQSVAFCNPVNMVQSAWKNRAGENPQYASAALADKFSRGYRIDVLAYRNFVPSSCHQEVELYLKPEKKTQADSAVSDSTKMYQDNSGNCTLSGQGMKGLTSIIILNFNGADHIKSCIESIQQCSRAPHEIIVVDNGSSDHSLSYLRSVPGIKLIANPQNEGAPYARNQGLAVAQGEYIAFLDNDTIVTRGWLQGFIDYAKQLDPNVGVFGPMSNYVSGAQKVKNVSYSTFEELQRFADQWAVANASNYRFTGRLILFCMFVKREVLQKIGGIDPAYGKWGWEDDDFCIRALIAGYKLCIAQQIYIHHTGSQTLLANRIDQVTQLNSGWDVFRKKWEIDWKPGEPVRYPLSKIAAQPFDPAKHVVGIPPHVNVAKLFATVP